MKILLKRGYVSTIRGKNDVRRIIRVAESSKDLRRGPPASSLNFAYLRIFKAIVDSNPGFIDALYTWYIICITYYYTYTYISTCIGVISACVSLVYFGVLRQSRGRKRGLCNILMIFLSLERVHKRFFGTSFLLMIAFRNRLLRFEVHFSHFFHFSSREKPLK